MPLLTELGVWVRAIYKHAGDRSVNSGDIAQTKSKSGQVLDGTNFRNDVTVEGSLNSGDIGLVKSKSGTALP